MKDMDPGRPAKWQKLYRDFFLEF